MAVSWRDIKTQLTGLDADTLISLIHDLYALNKENKVFLQGKVGGKGAYAGLLEDGIKKIIHEFFPERGFGKARIAPVKKIISGYKKATGDPIGIADLTLVFIEQIVKYCSTYGGMEESKYSSLSVAMNDLFTILKTCPAIIDVLNIEDRLIKAHADASNCGYGVEDEISELIDDIADLG
ncbi:MAG TPA: hypothetical protein VN429_05730 [Methanospirillum sp.]|uniref:DUF6155 family protein n=1 Tax=Methanospirillum sp. TaxID=45200 RepID=UPI002C39853C|nr:hypothetical protein [Methanospirillum sp.]HWQ63897.1 hypothetical protein [Methanospirillum sp.]